MDDDTVAEYVDVDMDVLYDDDLLTGIEIFESTNDSSTECICSLHASDPSTILEETVSGIIISDDGIQCGNKAWKHKPKITLCLKKVRCTAASVTHL